MSATNLTVGPVASSPNHGVLHNDIIISSSSNFPAILSCTAEDIIDKSILDFSPKFQLNNETSVNQFDLRLQAANQGLSQSFEWRFQKSDGSYINTIFSIQRQTSIQNTQHFVFQVRVLDGRVLQKDTVRESKQLLQQMMDNASAIIYVKDYQGRFQFVNHQFAKMFKIDEKEIVGKSSFDIFPAPVAQKFLDNDHHVFAKKQAMEFEESVEIHEETFTYSSIKFPLFDAEHNVYAVCGISNDITAKKTTDDAFRNIALGVSGSSYDNIFDSIVWHLAETLDIDLAFIGRYQPDKSVATNAIYYSGKIIPNISYQLEGSPCAGVVGKDYLFVPKDIQQLYPGDNMLAQLELQAYAGFPLYDSTGVQQGLISIGSKQPLTETNLIRSILEIFSVRASAELERLEADEAKRHSEDALRKSEDRLRATFEAALDAIISMDENGNIIDFNPAAETCFGYTRKQAMGSPLTTLIIPERYRSAHNHGISEFLSRGSGKNIGKRVEVSAMRSDGSEFPAELAIDVMQGVEGHIFIGYVRDITERKNAEVSRTRLEAQLRQAQKMETIGHLTGGIAHDFNNILTSIMGNIVLAEDLSKKFQDSKLDKYLTRANRSGGKARNLIQQMLTFSRGQRGEPRPLALGNLVKESVKLLEASLPSSVEMEVRIAPNVSKIMIDPVHFEQILVNLCINARDAIDGCGSIAISVKQQECLECNCESCKQAFSGHFVELTVKDNGSGIPTETMDRMFDPFYSTKEVGKGSGMGLSTVHGIVHEYSGHIKVVSEVDLGTSISILFQSLEQTKLLPEENIEAELVQESSTDKFVGRVLLVDDEADVIDFMQDLLENWGLEVLACKSSLESLEIFKQDINAFSLIITDNTMPKLTGVQLAKEIHKLNPAVPIILYTGYREDIKDQELDSVGIKHIISKPIDVPATQQIVKELLQSN